MAHSQQSLRRFFVPLALAFSITVSGTQAYAGPGDVNSVNDGQVVQGGTYYNTPGNKTTFQNSGGSGLWVKSGTTVRGLESDIGGTPTGNGGWLHFNAPGQVVRIDGNVSVSALMKGGAYVGDGGRVTIDSAFLYQNGAIFANGRNGGMVQFNTGSAMFGPNALIEAKGFGVTHGLDGKGGVVSVNATGVVDVQRGAVIDTSGQVVGTYDRNVINIEGGLINMEGVLRADGVVYNELNGDYVTGSQGGTIRLVANGNSNVLCVDCPVSKSTDKDIDLSVVSLNQTGSAYDDAVAQLEASGNIFTAGDRQAILNRQENLIASSDGDIVIGDALDASGVIPANPANGLISANGGDGVDYGVPAWGWNGSNGGSIILAARNNVVNGGVVRANGGDGVFDDPGYGGHGGTIAMIAGNDIINDCIITANGGNGADVTGPNGVVIDNGTAAGGGVVNASVNLHPNSQSFYHGGDGGNGGVIGFSYANTMTNNGLIAANGGNGGKGGDAEAYATSIQQAGSATANAFARGGRGGDGGSGGVIVFSGDDNPTGTGSINANGGQGGDGGYAWAIAKADNSSAGAAGGAVTANADAIGGRRGTRGEAGLIVAPDTTTIETDQNVSAKAGQHGSQGDAIAKAYAKGGGIDGVDVTANANATTGFAGFAFAEADAEVPNKGDAVANANATAGNYGKAEAIANANAFEGLADQAAANANATAGNRGIALSDANAKARRFDAVANANSTTGNFGYSQALADAIGTASSSVDATANTNAITGNNGDAISEANAETGNGFATANALLTTGNNGRWRGQVTINGSAGGFGSIVPTSPVPGGPVAFIPNGIVVETASTPNAAPVGYTPPTLTGGNQLATTQDNEVLVGNDDPRYPGSGGNNIILLSRGNAGSVTSIITNAVANNADRSVDNKFGGALGATHPSEARNFTVGDTSNAGTLVFDSAIPASYDNLVNLTAVRSGDIEVEGNWETGSVSGSPNALGGGHIALISTYGNLTNMGKLATVGNWSGGSINLFAGHSFAPVFDGLHNNGIIATNNGQLADHGGSIILKSNHSIFNDSDIDASGGINGGSIHLAAPYAILNLGTIKARAQGVIPALGGVGLAGPFDEALTAYSGNTFNGHGHGGHIYSKAGLINLNLGEYNTDADVGGTGYGGFIWHHANTISANVDLNQFGLGGLPFNSGLLSANGDTFGGKILLTGGDLKDDHSNDSLTVFERLNAAFGLSIPNPGDPVLIPYGVSSTDGVNFLAGFDLNLAESAYNLGSMSALGATKNGFLGMAGNNQLVIGPTATFNGVAYNAAQPKGGQLLLLAGQNLNGQTAVWALACGDPPEDPPEDPPGGNPNFDNFGLFQEDRWQSPEFVEPRFRMLLALSDPNLFLASTYLPVTEEILALALEEYHRQIALGQVPEEGRRHAALYLTEAGVTPEVAAAILEQVNQGVLKASAPVVTTLEEIISGEPNAGDNFDELIQ